MPAGQPIHPHIAAVPAPRTRHVGTAHAVNVKVASVTRHIKTFVYDVAIQVSATPFQLLESNLYMCNKMYLNK